MRAKIMLMAAAAAMLAWPAAATVTGTCAAPSSLTRLDAPLPHTAARLAANQPVTIIAIGSSSTAGAGASSPSKAYPSRLMIALTARFPDAKIRVLNRGINGEIERQMEARFEHDVLLQHPDLVIWQVGTNSVLRDTDITAYRPALAHGIDKLKASGADVLIMDLQYAPKVLLHRGYEDMLRKISTAARDENVAIFHRFAIMQYWASSGEYDTASMLSPDQLHMNDLSYGCIANLMADAITDAVQSPPAAGTLASAPAGGPIGAGAKRHAIDVIPVKTAGEAVPAKK